MPIGEIPIIEIVLRQLRHFGFKKVTLAVGHLGELIRAYIENNPTRFAGLEIDYAFEESPTGTAGSLARIPGLRGTFLAMNGDVLTTLDYSRVVQHHLASEAALTIATCRKRVKIDLGVIQTDPTSQVTAYTEKPEFEYLVSMGVYLYEPRALHLISENESLDFPDLVNRLLVAGEKVATYTWEGYWLDIGRPDDFRTAVDEFSRSASEFNID
jgi:NDP-sugar pyrophosphorylase family protein